jgi:arylformamidase
MEEPMDWIDVSVPLHEDMAVFTGDPRFHIERTSSMADGAVCNVSRMDLGVHTGTHVDAPVHFLDGGEGAETIPLDALIGPAWVVDAAAAGPTITAEDVEGFDIPAGEVRLLFRTRSANLWDAPAFDPAFVAPDATGAEALVRRGVRLIGMDYLSAAPFGDPTPTHRILLSAGVVVLEGLDLRAVTPGSYELLCLPLRIVGSDGAPARALLRRRG